ncbi:hypothetical protein [Nocardiopsis halophila]|uniref:hypothetical protein n=1 Tax=Nocardiopsis halophila TaxID=141692 RepID=UPI0003488C82|nr:hypothetical protein [Nocardiopsis halophila]
MGGLLDGLLDGVGEGTAVQRHSDRGTVGVAVTAPGPTTVPLETSDGGDVPAVVLGANLIQRADRHDVGLHHACLHRLGRLAGAACHLLRCLGVLPGLEHNDAD